MEAKACDLQVLAVAPISFVVCGCFTVLSRGPKPNNLKAVNTYIGCVELLVVVSYVLGGVCFSWGAKPGIETEGKMASYWSRITHPIRTAKALRVRFIKFQGDAQSFLAKHENDPRYLLNPKLIAKEQARAERAPNVSSCTRLEASLDQFDPAAANRHLRRLGCLLVRGNSETRAAVANYRDFLDQVGYTKMGVPRGGTLWFKGEGGFQFHMHRLVQKQFYEMCRLYLGSDVLLSSAGTTASIRTVAPSKGGLVPFHQDISPVDIQRALTFWVAIDPDGIGQDAPGLRFIASTKTRRTKIMLRDVSSHELIGPGLRSNEFFWTPRIDAGDVMIFDPYVPHASYSDSAMTLPRTSVDLRVSRFDPRQAISYSKAGHGAIIFDRTEMVVPAVMVAERPPEFAYDLAQIVSPALRMAAEAVGPR